jgi:hypothetical protein
MVAISQGHPLIIEGEFSSYGVKWTQSIANVFASVIAIQDPNIIIQDNWNLKTYVRLLSDGSAVDDDSFAVDLSMPSGAFIAKTTTSKYIARVITSSQFEIWKDGAVLDTVTIAGAGQDIQTIAISYDGKYIVVADEANNDVICYEGS